MKSIFVTRNA